MLPKTLLVATAALPAILAANAAPAETRMLPGLYETRTSSPGKPGGTKARDCLTPEDVKIRTIERQLAEAVKDGSCKLGSRTVGGGKFAVSGTCNNGGIRSTFKQTGTYSPTAMSMNMSMTMVPAPGARPISMTVVSTSRRIAPTCPAGSGDA
ncbi:DUF3617 domain-containing protein [Altericroceibacterium xinjiangense]|uniref:DUF3617 domain-containing protein n=1 Tax=Altericroceibacterium xinjiangense TaxID=762261 RepID=UPI000F7E995C|nr:DUF3617 domain-containing protein [Altericroceibacterium xinjiangense]